MMQHTTIPDLWMDALRAELGVPRALLGRLGALSSECVLEPGERLDRDRDMAATLYLVTEGKLVVTLEPESLSIQELGAGDIVGEIALDGRSAVRATERTHLLACSQEHLDALAGDAPVLVSAFGRALEDRLRRMKIASYLRRLFGTLDLATLREVEARVKWVTIAAGEELFRMGDPAEGAYVVALGRLRVVVGSPSGERVIDEVAPGEWVGEMALLTRTNRSATVYAARDSELAWLSNDVFDELAAKYPRLLLETSRILVARLQRHMTSAGATHGGTRTYAVVPLGDSLDVRWFVAQLARSLASHGSFLHLTPDLVDARLRKPGIAKTRGDGTAHVQLSGWLMEQERSHDYVLYEGDASASEWTNRSIRHADHVLFIADGKSSPKLTDAERALTAPDASSRLPRVSLVLLHSGAHHHSYPGTRAWISARKLHDHHHVRNGRVADVERVARILTGNAVGVVFGGGASRGYAHIGVVRALEQAGVTVDAVGGSSIGAVIALAKAGELSAAEMLATVPPLMRAAFFDPTLPLVSLMRGVHTLEGVRKSVGGPVEIEDFVLPMFAVSTNLTRGEQVVHRTGPIDLAIRASGSVPGIFPPVPWNGDLLVDGGLSNNVPADVMMSLFGPKVVAVDVIPDVELPVNGDLPASVSGWNVALRFLNPLAKNVGLPNILSTLMRSAMLSSRGLRSVDPAMYPHLLYLRPAVSRWNLIDFRAAEPVAEEGYRGSLDAITTWWTRERPIAK